MLSSQASLTSDKNNKIESVIHQTRQLIASIKGLNDSSLLSNRDREIQEKMKPFSTENLTLTKSVKALMLLSHHSKNKVIRFFYKSSGQSDHWCNQAEARLKTLYDVFGAELHNERFKISKISISGGKSLVPNKSDSLLKICQQYIDANGTSETPSAVKQH